MPSLTQRKTLNYPAQTMFELVMDIEKYPEFLPWCRDARITKKISDTNLEAELLIKFKGFFEKYTSDVKFGKISEDVYFVDVVAIKGPFKNLVNKWKFKILNPEECEIEFFIDFEFNSKILSKLIGAIFKRATEKMMTAFEERAKEIYHLSSNI